MKGKKNQESGKNPQRSLILAAQMTDREVEAVAGSPQLYRRLQARIQARRELGAAAGRLAIRPGVWKWAAAALAVFLGAALLLFRNTAGELPEAAGLHSPATETAASGQAAAPIPTPHPEAATGFLPLAYWGDPEVLDNSHIIRVELPRSSLVSFAIPLELEIVGDTVQADVLLSDDGLPLAIRFVL